MTSALHSIIFLVFRTLAQFGWSRAAAWALVFTSRPVSVPDRPVEGKRLRALVMDRHGFNQDIDASVGRSGEFEILKVHRRALKGIAAGILAPGLDDNHYLTNDPDLEASKLAYRRFLRAMWRHVQRLKPFDVVLSANFGYYAEREFAIALEEEGTPFIVMHKENMKSPGRVAFFRSIYSERRGRFGGRRIFVYNDIERDLQVESGVADPRQVVVTGMARLDRVHEWRRQNAGKHTARPQVLFFSFWRRIGLPMIARKSATASGKYERLDGNLASLSWEELASGTHRAMIELARLRPDVDVIIKSKGRPRELADTWAMLGGEDAKLPSNLHLVTRGDPFDSLAMSSVVVGFNTTGLLEGLAAGRPVVVPWFGETAAPWARDYVVDLGDAVEYAPSVEGLVENVIRHLDKPGAVPAELSEPAKQALDRWLGNADGAAGERIVAAIKAEIGVRQP